MKKSYSFVLAMITGGSLFAGTSTQVDLVSATPNSTTVHFLPGSFDLSKVSIGQKEAYIIRLDKGSRILEAGAPDLAKLTSAVMIPDRAEMKVEVTAANFYDVPNMEIGPSKGNLKRNIYPQAVPYVYGNSYKLNAFYPSEIASLGSPYILRDVRGQAVHVVPFQYNPVTKVLRVYTDITVKISVKDPYSGQNTFARTSAAKISDPDFNAIYENKFINYKELNPKTDAYTPVSENGCMLVICYDQFGTDMQPFVRWKNQKGIPCEMVLKSQTGALASDIETYIQNYYSTHPTLKYVLLVGDAAQIPASSTPNGDSDNNYGYLTGSDSYPELFVGRFSAQTSTHVQTMVNRAINYEKTPQSGGAWYSKGTTIASDQGPGDDNEYDWQHERNIRTKLLAYKFNGNTTYANVSEIYDGSQGGIDAAGYPTSTMISTEVNTGTGFINYTGHGSDFSWSTSGFSVTGISNLTNTTAHPCIISVGCVNGNFVPNNTCFAEAWQRAGTPAAPKGAAAAMMSTINQSWDPPMEGQDAMVDILVESVAGNIKRTFGGIAMNGCMQMNDVYGAAGAEMTDTWDYFGDPSMMMYTMAPMAMTTNHNATEAVGVSSITVSNNVNGALICLSVNGVILGTGISNGTNATITFPAINTSGTIIDVVATSYNYMPYKGTITVSGATGVSEYSVNASTYAYPVPASDILMIEFNVPTAGIIKVSLVNNLGQDVLQILNSEVASGGFTETVDVSKLSKGIYTCRMEIGKNIQYQKIVIQ